MGRGDIKSKKGKIFAGSFGKSRPSKTVKSATKAAPATPATAAAPAKKSAAKK